MKNTSTENKYYNQSFAKHLINKKMASIALWSSIMLGNIGRHGKTLPYKHYTTKYGNMTDTKYRNISNSNRTQGTIEQNFREAKSIKYRNRRFARLDEFSRVYAEENRITCKEFVECYLSNQINENKTQILVEEKWGGKKTHTPNTNYCGTYLRPPKKDLQFTTNKRSKTSGFCFSLHLLHSSAKPQTFTEANTRENEIDNKKTKTDSDSKQKSVVPGDFTEDITIQQSQLHGTAPEIRKPVTSKPKIFVMPKFSTDKFCQENNYESDDLTLSNDLQHIHDENNQLVCDTLGNKWPRGIENNFQACWLISMLQAFAWLITSVKVPSPLKPIPKLIANILYEIFPQEKYNQPYIPYNMIADLHFQAAKKIGSNINRQQDVGDFFTTSFGNFLEDIGINTTLLSTENWKCLKCQTTISAFSDKGLYNILTLTIDDINSVQEAIEKFFTEEIREDILCEKCNENTPKSYKLSLESIPQILVIQLVRFKVKEGKPSKVRKHVEVNTQVELDYDDAKYNLRSVIQHRGQSLYSGHYVCYTKIGNNILEINDETVTEITKLNFDTAVQNDGYIMVYEKKKKTIEYKF